MSSQMTNGRTPEPPRRPQRDTQWWLGWLAAVLVVIIIIAVGALAWLRLSQTEPENAEVQMTPLVGGMTLVTATPTSAMAAETPAPPTAQVIAAASETLTVTVASPVTETATVPTVEVIPAEAPVEEAVSEVVTVTATMGALPVETATAAPTATEPTATPAPTATPTVTPIPTATPLPPTPTPIPAAVVRAAYTPGDQVASRAGRLTLYAGVATDAPVLDSYGAGVALTVIEPTGDYSGYPVVADGHGWVRVRAADGLVGWVMTDTLERYP